MKEITKIRKAVCTMANELKKAGYSLSQAFKKAWKRIIGYVPKGLARELAKVIDTGVQAKAYLMQIIGGYSYKETLGALINITI